MTDYYSNHLGPLVGATGHFTTRNTTQRAIPSGLGHSRLRWKGAQLTVPNAQDLADNDVIRLMDMSSSDRLIQLFFSMDGNWGATTTFNVGLYAKGVADDGAVIDEDLFGSAIDWAAAIARVDYFTEAGTLDNWDRGKQLWELANIGLAATTYSASTNAVWTITAQCSQNIDATDAAVEFLMEAIYVSGD